MGQAPNELSYDVPLLSEQKHSNFRVDWKHASLSNIVEGKRVQINLLPWWK